MEKKVLLQDLVENGSHVRKQIVSKVRVSDKGIYPIGELWDANTTLDIIVNGAHEAHDTVRELDEFAHSVNRKVDDEINRAKNAERQLNEKIGDLGLREQYVSNEYDYVYNESSWNESYQNGGLKLYYEWEDEATKPYKEDLWNTVEQRAANINDARKDPNTGEFILDENGSYIYDNCIRCWEGAVNAPGAAYPWIIPHFDTDVNAKIIFKYKNQIIQPWGERIFGNGEGHKAWGCASVRDMFDEEFNIEKFRMILLAQDPQPYTVKQYIDDNISSIVYNITTGILEDNSVGTNHIIDGTILMEDLSDEIKDKLEVTVDEDEENAHFG